MSILFHLAGCSWRYLRAWSIGHFQLAQTEGSETESLKAGGTCWQGRCSLEGHTDIVPIHNSHFPSNWELSTARATELVKIFVLRYHVIPSRLSAARFAEFHPADDNSTPEGRAHNRRVDIVILNPVLDEKSPILSPGPALNPLSAPAPASPTPSPGTRPQAP
jgi:hypothetical protein